MSSISAEINSENDSSNVQSLPRRFIYRTSDMEHFKTSSAKRELLSFVTTLGRSTISTSYTYDPSQPLIGLSPGMACLHGALRCIASEWLSECPPDKSVHARFGNPMFKAWHSRLMDRSSKIISSVMDVHLKHVLPKQNENDDSPWELNLLETCSDEGFKAASSSSEQKNETNNSNDENDNSQQNRVLVELQSYIHLSFGHPIRLDFGTGHESSFFVFLYSLCKIGIFGNIPKSSAPKSDIMAPVALSIVSQYLEICRGLQTDYMLEPAGSHGVWGLDDYHCIPFYIGACQFQNASFEGEYHPSDIHNEGRLNSPDGKSFMYFQCIAYIKSLKKGVPFFESSPMLDDISQLGNWQKVSGGLLRLYEGEVLDKMPVVQHFLFGDIYKATWVPSTIPVVAPRQTFTQDPDEETKCSPNSRSPPPTKAPWAK